MGTGAGEKDVVGRPTQTCAGDKAQSSAADVTVGGTEVPALAERRRGDGLGDAGRHGDAGEELCHGVP